MSNGPIDRYLHDLRGRVPGGPLRRRRVRDEVRAHLEDTAEKEQRAGHTRDDAERIAVERFGMPFADRRRTGATRIVPLVVVAVVVVGAIAVTLAGRGGAGTPRPLLLAMAWSSAPICPSAGSGPVTAALTVRAGGRSRTVFLPCRPQAAVGEPRVPTSAVGTLPAGATVVKPILGAALPKP